MRICIFLTFIIFSIYYYSLVVHGPAISWKYGLWLHVSLHSPFVVHRFLEEFQFIFHDFISHSEWHVAIWWQWQYLCFFFKTKIPCATNRNISTILKRLHFFHSVFLFLLCHSSCFQATTIRSHECVYVTRENL